MRLNEKKSFKKFFSTLFAEIVNNWTALSNRTQTSETRILASTLKMFTDAKINEIVYNNCVKEYFDLYKPAFGVNYNFLRQYDLFFLVVVAH